MCPNLVYAISPINRGLHNRQWDRWCAIRSTSSLKVISISSGELSCRVLKHLTDHNSLNTIQYWFGFQRRTPYQAKFSIGFRTVTKQTVSDDIFTNRKRSLRPCFYLKLTLSSPSACNICIEQKLITRTDANLIATSKICIAALGFADSLKNSLQRLFKWALGLVHNCFTMIVLLIAASPPV